MPSTLPPNSTAIRMQKPALVEPQCVAAAGQPQSPRRFPPPSVCGRFVWSKDKRDGPRRTLLAATREHIGRQVLARSFDTSSCNNEGLIGSPTTSLEVLQSKVPCVLSLPAYLATKPDLPEYFHIWYKRTDVLSLIFLLSIKPPSCQLNTK